MNVQSTSESFFVFFSEQAVKQVVSLKGSEVYLSIDTENVGVITKGSP